MIEMTPLERVLCTLGHREPDRVPFFLLLTMHGARELGVGIREYYHSPELVVEAQLRLRKRYGHDCLYGFLYAAVESEAWGGETAFREDGPPNAAAPCITAIASIPGLAPPRIEGAPGLMRVLAVLAGLKARSQGSVPIIGTVMSPFSLPVLQLGFENYLELIYLHRELFWELMRLNTEFCVAWANAQLAAGANAICYFDPLSSPEITPASDYLQLGGAVARATLPRIKGPTATHLASGRVGTLLDQVAGTGTAAIGVSAREDLAELKAALAGRLAILGNLNGLEMGGWSPREAELQVRRAIAAGAPGGGFILADNHGEIPWQVPETVLEAISETVRRYGSYPIAKEVSPDA
ncbi:methylcobamide--CoM methyltransferase [Geomonas silvestris]|uniref:Methylcobamide--CoM methyltransferase n=1 Tax=Geomonas silvestris TaxID=2740184 RepID=A0A6V8MGC6_9BACT|nr:uroporphyrinogen decarboxylase family protein [Geomonas silvestris]GFO59002.1 methylcobamide--CoM methyltransferase [Geomonas silvestris]